MSFTDDLTEILRSIPVGYWGQSPDQEEVLQQKVTAIKQAIAESLPEREVYDDYEHGSHAEGWNAALTQVKQNLDLTTKENPE